MWTLISFGGFRSVVDLVSFWFKNDGGESERVFFPG